MNISATFLQFQSSFSLLVLHSSATLRPSNVLLQCLHVSFALCCSGFYSTHSNLLQFQAVFQPYWGWLWLKCGALPSHLDANSSNLEQYGGSTEQSLTLFFLTVLALAFPCGHKQSQGILQTTPLWHSALKDETDWLWPAPAPDPHIRQPVLHDHSQILFYTCFFLLFHRLFDCLMTTPHQCILRSELLAVRPLRVVCWASRCQRKDRKSVV